MNEEVKPMAVIRIRGNVGVREPIERTMQLLKLKKVNNCVIVPYNKYYKGMLQKIKDYATFGEISKDVFEKLLFKWGRIEGDKKVTPEYLKEKGITVDDLYSLKVKFKDVGIKQPFRLHPPRKGYKSIKRPFTMKGDLGYRGEKINELLERMI